MKKLILTLGLAALTLASAQAQGTINPLNGTLSRVKIDSNGNCAWETTDQNVDASLGLTVGVFWGAAGGSPDNFAGNMTIGTTPGVLVGLPSIFAIPGAGDVGTVISLQMRVTSDGLSRNDADGARVVPGSQRMEAATGGV